MKDILFPEGMMKVYFDLYPMSSGKYKDIQKQEKEEG